MSAPRALFVPSALCLLGALAVSAGARADDAPPAADAAAVEAALRAYEDAWSRHDAHAIAGFYHEPALRVGQAGPHVRATREAQEKFFAGFLPGLIAQGYKESRWQSLSIKMLDDRTALASGVVVRLREDGSELQRQGVTYGLWRTPDGWKIFMSSTHPPENAPSFK